MSERTPEWEQSPAAILEVTLGAVTAVNQACLALLVCESERLLARPEWLVDLFQEKSRLRFETFLKEDKRESLSLETNTYDGQILYIRFRKRRLADGRIFVSLEDHTEIREDTQALQAGYDEFIRVTTDLEQALVTIEQQNRLLEHQAGILQNELRIAHAVQSQVFNRDFDNFQIVKAAGSYETMAQLGGDMWEFYENDRTFTAVIGDVMGHGVASSLISIAAKNIFKKRFEENDRIPRSLAEIATIINTELMEVTKGNSFMTACMVRVDRDGRVEFLTAGHPPIFLVRRNTPGPGEQLAIEQPMLGIFGAVQYVDQKIRLEAGDRLLLYTDCLLESFSPDGDPLDLVQATEVMRTRPGHTPAMALKGILDFRHQHARSETLPDDLAIVCIEIPEPQPATAGPSGHQSRASR